MEMGFDGKSSLSYYGLDLQHCYLTAAKRKRSLVDVLAADGSIDSMAGFEPTYERRTLTAAFNIISHPEETRNRLINELEGRTVEIILPNNSNYYMIGDIHIAAAGNQVGALVQISADCLPWRYSRFDIIHRVASSENAAQYVWRNAGTRLAVPEITVESEVVVLTVNGEDFTLVKGVHLLPELAIPGSGEIIVTAVGGTFSAQYKEAIL